MTITPYERFLSAVACRQLCGWLPQQPARILDLSGDPDISHVLTSAGHHVVATHRGPPHPAVQRVVAEVGVLDWLADASVDAVVAEGSGLSRALAAEVTLEHIARVLRPGGRLLLSVTSLGTGLAHLARHGRWAELADVPAADVVLVPDEDGTIFRCYTAEELAGALREAGLDVEWVRPRTVLGCDVVDAALRAEPERLDTLVRAELGLAAERSGETVGRRLVASARRPG